MRILLVEDDQMLGRALLNGLTDHGMAVDWVRNGADAHETLQTTEYAVVLLDLGLPGMPGIEVLKAFRGSRGTTPIIIITAKDRVDDRISGLDSGADDYIVKPFELGELMARIRAVVRRNSGQAQTLLSSSEVTLDLATHEVAYRGHSEILPAKEFALMEALMLRAGTILSRAQLEERLYGWGAEVESNAVDFLIHSIRKKFDRDIVHNVRGAGWMILKERR